MFFSHNCAGNFDFSHILRPKLNSIKGPLLPIPRKPGTAPGDQPLMHIKVLYQANLYLNLYLLVYLNGGFSRDFAGRHWSNPPPPPPALFEWKIL